MTPELKEVCEHLWAMAKEMMLETAQVPLTFFFIKKKRSNYLINVLPTPPTQDRVQFNIVKRVFSQFVSKLAKELQVTMIVAISEVWMTETTFDNNIMSSEHPDRVERVMMVCMDASGKTSMKIGNIVRIKDMAAIHQDWWTKEDEHIESHFLQGWTQ